MKIKLKNMFRFLYNFKDRCFINQKQILGNKGANLNKISNIDIPVPEGFTISTDIHYIVFWNHYVLCKKIKKFVINNIKYFEKINLFKSEFHRNSLMISIRSGSFESMPGIMSSVLNMGLNFHKIKFDNVSYKDFDFIFNCYKRYFLSYSKTVLGVDDFNLSILNRYFYKKIYNLQKEINKKKIMYLYHNFFFKNLGQIIHQNMSKQLEQIILSIIKSWYNIKSKKYRDNCNISSNLGTAVTIQFMVFGNINNKSGTGVVFSRNPSTGYNKPFGDFMICGQGDDIVSGINIPNPINIYSNSAIYKLSMQEIMPENYVKLIVILKILENFYKDLQDVEFTVENSILWILQTRSGKRTNVANIEISMNMLKQKLLNRIEVLNSIKPNMLENIFYSTIENNDKNIITTGEPISPGAICGKVIFDANSENIITSKHNVVFVKNEILPEDIINFCHVSGVLTKKGGATSHASVLTRGMGKPYVVVHDIYIDKNLSFFKINNKIIKKGDFISIDGTSGKIFSGHSKLKKLKLKSFNSFLKEIKYVRSSIKIMANVDNIKDCIIAKKLGMEGIGLCRTEHMFFQENKIKLFRSMILSKIKNIRINILKILQKFQEEDFYNLIKKSGFLPIIIRLLDPPLHEFLPKINSIEVINISKYLNISLQKINENINEIKETNSNFGHRGCRIGITHPEIYQMQIHAILKVISKIHKEDKSVKISIMIPFIINYIEFLIIKKLIKNIINKYIILSNHKVKIDIGIMIELPVIILDISKIIKDVDFISFGTNDLTQTCLGMSRDDTASFLTLYIRKKIFIQNPFISIEKNSVGKLITLGILEARKINPTINIGVCGEHAGDPCSIKFFEKRNVNYISCTPYRLPIVQLLLSKFNY